MFAVHTECQDLTFLLLLPNVLIALIYFVCGFKGFF